jgi:hypothetical protein
VSAVAETQTLDAWVCEQLAAFAPLGPAELNVLAAILSYDPETYRTTMGEQR